MKQVTVTFPVAEAIEVLRLLRGESRCLIEQNEFLSDHDLNKRANYVLSARERLCTSVEEIADLEDTVADPSQMAINIPSHKESPTQSLIDVQLERALNDASGEDTPKRVVVDPNPWEDYHNANPVRYTRGIREVEDLTGPAWLDGLKRR